ncbi:YigZ family protein [Caldalkalibacillus salinus]|uniref:YigZ family protein n=1 Tax=Caldalkalibacillus salinus TaxID=2803787 RepID=UPI001921F65B|nr:YigZ family protein [Caldalkalibacillus salinus]
MLKTYRTVKGYGEKEIVIDKSRFIGYVERAETEEEATTFIEKIKKQHYNATHNCSAYLIGENDQIQKAHDDGEPSGTAGVPMLETLKKQGLKDVVVVSTRYFGGIKLGAGGLIRAYTASTVAGLKAAHIIERQLHQKVSVTVDYTLLGKVENDIRHQTHLHLEHIDYLESVTIHVLVPMDDVTAFKKRIVDLTNDQCQIKEDDQQYIDTVIDSEA